MDILADENVDYGIFQQIKRDGFNIEHIKDISAGIDDEEVLAIANDNKAIFSIPSGQKTNGRLTNFQVLYK